jgi:hypothetical protein
MKNLCQLILILTIVFSGACAKKISLNKPSSAQELLEKYRTQPRSPVSASFQAISSRGFFQGEIYVEKAENLTALLFAYLPIGEPLFQITIQNNDFIYIDLSAKTAYSNRKDWLKDFETKPMLNTEQGLLNFFQIFLKALAGELKPEMETFSHKGNLIKLSEKTDSGFELEYLFKKSPLRLMQINQTGDSNFHAEFSYPGDCWFPDQIKLKNDELKLDLKLSSLNCKETQKPEINFSSPPGFRAILIEQP